MAHENDGIGIVEAKCKSCGFVAYGSNIEVVNGQACLLCGEIVGSNPGILSDKEGPPEKTQLGTEREIASPSVDEPKKTHVKINSVTAMGKIKPLLTIEAYKCFILTIIAATLIGIFLKTPTPFTFRNVQNKIVDLKDIPLVRVRGGDMDVDVTNTVDVTGSVKVENTVEVEGSVSISR